MPDTSTPEGGCAHSLSRVCARTREPGCHTAGNCGSRAPPTTGRPSPWGRRPAPRRGRSPDDAGPPGTAASRWDGGGDRPHRPGDTPAPRWSPTIGRRYGKGLGHARPCPCPNPPEIRVPGHGWISHAPPFGKMDHPRGLLAPSYRHRERPGHSARGGSAATYRPMAFVPTTGERGRSGRCARSRVLSQFRICSASRDSSRPRAGTRGW